MAPLVSAPSAIAPSDFGVAFNLVGRPRSSPRHRPHLPFPPSLRPDFQSTVDAQRIRASTGRLGHRRPPRVRRSTPVIVPTVVNAIAAPRPHRRHWPRGWNRPANVVRVLVYDALLVVWASSWRCSWPHARRFLGTSASCGAAVPHTSARMRADTVTAIRAYPGRSRPRRSRCRAQHEYPATRSGCGRNRQSGSNEGGSCVQKAIACRRPCSWRSRSACRRSHAVTRTRHGVGSGARRTATWYARGHGAGWGRRGGGRCSGRLPVARRRCVRNAPRGQRDAHTLLERGGPRCGPLIRSIVSRSPVPREVGRSRGVRGLARAAVSESTGVGSEADSPRGEASAAVATHAPLSLATKHARSARSALGRVAPSPEARDAIDH